MFKADEPCFIKFVDIQGDDPSVLARRVTMIATKLDGSKVTVEGKLFNLPGQNNAVVQVARFNIGSWCSVIEINVQTFLRGLKATKFYAYGFTAGQLDSAAEKVVEVLGLISSIDAYASRAQEKATTAREAVEEAEAKQDEIQSEIDELEEKKTALTAEVDDYTKQSSELLGKKGVLEKDVVEYSARLSGAQSNEAQIKESVDRLSRDLVDKKDELKRVLNDRSLISDEYKDYVLEGKKQSRMYEWFLYFSIAIIAFCAWQLYVGAQKILVANVDDYREIWVLVLQRMPFAVAIGFIVGAAWKLAEMFVTRIMNIHAQRLALTRLLVIAKDTVYSSVDNLDIPDEVKFKERIKLKLQMLKSHLTSELGKEFEYRVSEDSKPRAPEVVDSETDRAATE